MHCTNCQTSLSENSKFCPSCGTEARGKVSEIISKGNEISPDSNKQCPLCKEFVHQEANKCKHCGADFEGMDHHFLDEEKKLSLKSADKRDVIKCKKCGYNGEMGVDKEWTPMLGRIGSIVILAIIFGFDGFLKMNGRTGMSGIWPFIVALIFGYPIFRKAKIWKCPSCEELLAKFRSSFGTDVISGNSESRQHVDEDKGQPSDKRIRAFTVGAVIVASLFGFISLGAGFSVWALLFFGGWLVFAGVGFYTNWSFTIAFGVGFIVALFVFFGVAIVSNSSGPGISIAQSSAVNVQSTQPTQYESLVSECTDIAREPQNRQMVNSLGFDEYVELCARSAENLIK